MDRRCLAAALCAALVGIGALALAQQPPAYRVIVNPRNPMVAIDRKALAQLFLKKATRWSDGQLARPVDLDADSAVRRRFSEEALNRSVSAVKSYWQQMIFAGRDVPPPEFDTDEEVVRFVTRNRGAVGYVSGNAATGTARILPVR